jgi:hypothetical protein
MMDDDDDDVDFFEADGSDVGDTGTPQGELADGLGLVDDDMTPARRRRKDYEVEFKVLAAGDVARTLAAEQREVSGLLGVPEPDAFALLQLFRWKQDRLLEAYYSDEHGTLVRAGVVPVERRAPETAVGPVAGFACAVCCDDSPGDAVTLVCGHRACLACYREYVNTKLANDADGRVRCIALKCDLNLPDTLLHCLATPAALQRCAPSYPPRWSS